MKGLVKIFAMALGVLAIFFAGFFVRQPKINKLKKQITHLQKEIKRLEALREEQNNTINKLLINYKSLKLFGFAKRSKAKDNIKSELMIQYGTKEYLHLLLDRIKNNRELSKEEIVFINAFDDVIEWKKVSTKDFEKIKVYIFNKYRKEIKGLVPCDYSDLLLQVKNYK